jgi:hypothetical protein
VVKIIEKRFGELKYSPYLCITIINQLNMSEDFEMFSKAGDRACQGLVNRITKKIQGKKRVTADDIENLVYEGMKKIALKHGEVFDTEPRYHIEARINKAMREAGYQIVFN